MSWDSTATTSGSKSAIAVARDAANNHATSSPVVFTVANEPTPSSVVATTATTTAVITWTSATAASSRAWFGLSSTYSTSTSESDTGDSRTTSHSVTISGLNNCTRYHYAVTGTNAGSDTATSSDAMFDTAGCTGGATISAASGNTITTVAGGTLTQGRLTLTVPASFTATSSSATFQASQIDSTAFFTTVERPDGLSSIGATVFHLVALTDATTSLSTFDSVLSVTLSYSESDVAEMDEASLQIYRYDGSAWHALSNCVTDTGEHTVTCNTSAFSDFSLFGLPSSDSGSSSNGGALPWCSGPFAPGWNTSLPNGGCSAAAVILAALPAFQHVPAASIVPSYHFTRTIRRGMSGKDVLALQQFLNTKGFTLAASGPGAPGEETSYFGQLTYAALVRYQDAHTDAILAPLKVAKGTGLFGPSTRTFVNSLSQ